MTCARHLYYCLFILVTISDILSTIMSLVYLVTFTDICYTPCGNTLFMYMYTLHCIYSALCISCKHYSVYSQHCSMVMLHTEMVQL